MKPIEPGCLALIINGDSPVIGRTCEVLEWTEEGGIFQTPAGPFENDVGWSGWAVDLGTGCGVFASGDLLRIDSGEDESVTAEQESEATA